MLLILMILCHLLDDFVLQAPFLSKYKQKESWENYPKFKNDYIACLVCHSLEWSAMILLPVFVLTSMSDTFLLSVFIGNAIIHGVVDHLKCNEEKITLITDQTIHLLQIILTFFLTNACM